MTTHLFLHSNFCSFFLRSTSLSHSSPAPSAIGSCAIPFPIPTENPLAYPADGTAGPASMHQTTLRQRTQPSQYGGTYAWVSCCANDVSVTDIEGIDALADSELAGAGTAGWRENESIGRKCVWN